MRNFMRLMGIFLWLGLSGCASLHNATKTSSPQNNNYLKQANSVPATKTPPGLNSSNVQNYYPIPPVAATQAGAPTPSTLPPGSQAQAQVAPQPMPAPAAASGFVQSRTNHSLILNGDFSQSWGKVGQALQSSGYQILQHDSGLKAYYILDTAETGGTLRTNTPIYQVHLNSAGNITEVTLTNEKNQPADAKVQARILGALQQKLN